MDLNCDMGKMKLCIVYIWIGWNCGAQRFVWRRLTKLLKAEFAKPLLAELDRTLGGADLSRTRLKRTRLQNAVPDLEAVCSRLKWAGAGWGPRREPWTSTLNGGSLVAVWLSSLVSRWADLSVVQPASFRSGSPSYCTVCCPGCGRFQTLHEMSSWEGPEHKRRARRK